MKTPRTMFVTFESDKLLRRLEEVTSDLITSLEESVLFADRRIVRKLRDAIIDLEGLKVSLPELRKGGSLSDDLSSEVAPLVNDLRTLGLSLSNFVRKELNLEEISADDLKSTYEDDEEEYKKAGK